MAERYVPTLGMIAALAGADVADEADVMRCQRRGLLDASLNPTTAGQLAIRRELQRRQDLAHGR